MGFIDTFKRSIGMEEETKRKSVSKIISEDLEESENVSITPDQPFFEIILIKPKSEDDMDYVRDQILEENPVIIDITYLEKESQESFEMLTRKLNIIRKEHCAEAILLAKTKDTNMILVSPHKVKVIKKG
ncbi:MAG: cell division protein SepF [Methanobrevibacter sp.]|jgi:SepF-like predicted cell division protein (DUF552 family)|nr:cell division protein SepF [Methanobrevibacter sp.]